MKKGLLISSYAIALGITFGLQSCVDNPITPNGGSNNEPDTTWVDDSTNNNPNGGNGNIDSTWTDPNGGNNGGDDSTDSTWHDPNGGCGGCGDFSDSTDFNGGN